MRSRDVHSVGATKPNLALCAPRGGFDRDPSLSYGNAGNERAVTAPGRNCSAGANRAVSGDPPRMFAASSVLEMTSPGLERAGSTVDPGMNTDTSTATRRRGSAPGRPPRRYTNPWRMGDGGS